MPGRVEVYALVQPAARIEALQLRAVAVGLLRQRPGGRLAQGLGIGIQLGPPGLRPGAAQGVLQRRVGLQQVVVAQFIHLVVDVVGVPKVHGRSRAVERPV